MSSMVKKKFRKLPENLNYPRREVVEPDEMGLTPLYDFPRTAKTYRPVVVSGDYCPGIMQRLWETDLEGCLRIDDDDFTTASFYVKLPNNKGVVAGRIDAKDCEGWRGAPRYFEAAACKYYIDNGTFEGITCYNQDTVGASFGGHGQMGMSMFGYHEAKVGDPTEVSGTKPWPIIQVDSLIASHEGDRDDHLPIGCINFNCFFDYVGPEREPSTSISFIFRPDDNAIPIPDAILAEIRQLPTPLYVDDHEEDDDDDDVDEVEDDDQEDDDADVDDDVEEDDDDDDDDEEEED